MADPESNFKYALSTISVHANTVWWNEGRDSYRLTNLSTWLDYLRSRAPEPSAENQAEQVDVSSSWSSWSRQSLQQVDYPEAHVSDPEAWLRGHAWPTAIARNYPAISSALSSSDSASLYHYNRVLEAVPRRKDPLLNANVPEFYPSVLPHHVDFPQSCSLIADQAYQMELFPYLEQSAEPDAQWQVPQVQVFTASNPENYPAEWRGRPNQCSFANLLLLQKAQKSPFVQGGQPRGGVCQQGTTPSGQTPQHRHPFQVYAGPGPQPQLLLNSDFPELPTVRESPFVQGGQPRGGMCQQGTTPSGQTPQHRHPFQVYAGPGPQPQLLLNSDFPELPTVREKTPEEMLQLCSWLEPAYPGGAAEIAELAASSSAFEEMAKRLSGQSLEEPRSQEVVIPSPTICRGEEIGLPTTPLIPQEPRRLYRDVLTSKGEDDSETTLEGKFEELEREALEQYISSENSGEVVETEGQSPELEDPYQDLERQAVEQYDEHGDTDVTTVLTTDNSTPAIHIRPLSTQEYDQNSYKPCLTNSSNTLIETPVFAKNDPKDYSIAPLVETIDSSEMDYDFVKCPLIFGVDNDVRIYQNASLAWSRTPDQLDYNPLSFNEVTQFSKSSFAPLPAVGVQTVSETDDGVEALVSASKLEPTSPKNERATRRKGREWRNKKGRRRSEACCSKPLSPRCSSVPAGGGEQELAAATALLPATSTPTHGLAFDGQASKHRRRDVPIHSHIQDSKELNIENKGKPHYYLLRCSNSSVPGQDSPQGCIGSTRHDKKESRWQRNKTAKTPVVRETWDADEKVLISSLKIKALNFLKDVEKKHLNEEKLTIRELLYGGEKQKIRNQVTVTDIQNTDVFKTYVKEIGALTRQHMDCIYKRVRKGILEMKTLYIAQPTMVEKRKVRYLIKKCLQLQERAEYLINVRKLPKKPLESSRKEIADTLHAIHKTMDVVYKLRDMCRDAKEELDEVKMGRQSLNEVVSGKVLLEAKPPRVRHKIQEEFRSLLIYLMCPRAGTVLYDRTFARLQSPEYMYALPLDMAINNYLLFNDRLFSADILNVVQIRFLNTPEVESKNSSDCFDSNLWNRRFVVRNKSYSVNLIIEEGIKYSSCSGFLKESDLEMRLRLKETNLEEWKKVTKLKSETSLHVKPSSIGDRYSCVMC